MNSLIFLLVLFSIIWTYILFLTSNSKHRKSGKLPPGPSPLPIIGNMLQLGDKPHQSLAKLSQTYGPLMYLKIGCIETVVVSSPEIARIVLQKYDQSFCSRRAPVTLESFEVDKFSMAWLPVDNQWRKLRRIWKEHMFSLQSLDASQGKRQEKLHKLCDYLNQCCVNGHVVDIAEATFTTSLNMLSSTLFSVDFADFNSDSSQEFKDVVWNVLKCIGSPNFADYFPILKYVDPQGISRRTKFYYGKLFAILENIIDQRLESRGTSEKNDLLEALLHLPEFSPKELKHLLMDLFLGGTDTAPANVEWAMTELLRNPKKMLKAKRELNDVIGVHGVIQESDISKLPYLQAVVKETLRLHPCRTFVSTS
ncbi:Cytochrome [Forsythia ovata]|uniref:Cytochrome n=1 Tax=Forsythia ovata TaxID=205694 RepID=A0ABD1QPL5_9LAMI